MPRIYRKNILEGVTANPNRFRWMIHEQAFPRPLSARESVVRESSAVVTDNDLVQAFLEGEESAFRQLVSRYKDPIINYANSMINDYDTAVDLAQETFIRVYRNAARYERKYQFSTWIYRIATNLAIDEIRNRKRRGRFFFMNVFPNYERNAIPLEISDGKPGHDETLLGQELSQALSVAIACLPERYRTAFVLKEVQELSYPEVAAILKTSEGTIKSRLHRAKILLREKLGPQLHSGGKL